MLVKQRVTSLYRKCTPECYMPKIYFVCFIHKIGPVTLHLSANEILWLAIRVKDSQLCLTYFTVCINCAKKPQKDVRRLQISFESAHPSYLGFEHMRLL